jgi:hypothetical protein
MLLWRVQTGMQRVAPGALSRTHVFTLFSNQKRTAQNITSRNIHNRIKTNDSTRLNPFAFSSRLLHHFSPTSINIILH